MYQVGIGLPLSHSLVSQLTTYAPTVSKSTTPWYDQSHTSTTSKIIVNMSVSPTPSNGEQTQKSLEQITFRFCREWYVMTATFAISPIRSCPNASSQLKHALPQRRSDEQHAHVRLSDVSIQRARHILLRLPQYPPQLRRRNRRCNTRCGIRSYGWSTHLLYSLWSRSRVLPLRRRTLGSEWNARLAHPSADWNTIKRWRDAGFFETLLIRCFAW